MKGLKSILLAAIVTIAASCNYIDTFTKPTLSLVDGNPSELKISNFTWGYGVTAINQFSGDFEKLDSKVYELLKAKEGICKVYLEQVTKDKYGNSTSGFTYIGDINITDLNKYQNAEYWHKDGGIRHLIYNHFVNDKAVDVAKTDTAVLEPAATDTVRTITPTIDTTTSEQSKKIYGFGVDDLRTNELDQISIANDQYIVDGIVTGVSFEQGVFAVQTDDSGEISVLFTPSAVSIKVYQKMLLAFKTGNKISSICAKQTDGTYALVTAEIDEP